jgi:hypothetical protein
MRSDEIASFEALARELTSNLDPERKGALLDLDPETRRGLLRSLHVLALERLERLDLSDADRAEARTHLVPLAETALENQGLLLPAAALYLLAHEEKCSEESAPSRLERSLLRFKLAHALLMANEEDAENICRCAEIVRWTIPQTDALWNQPGIPKHAFFALQYQMHEWLGRRYRELDLFQNAANHFSQAGVAARTADDRVSAALGLADCYEELGDPQRANEMLMLCDDDIAKVDDEEILEEWELTRDRLRFLLGGNLHSQEGWPQAPQWSFLEKSASAFLDFDRQPGAPSLEDAVAAVEDMLARTPMDDVNFRGRLLTQLVSLAVAKGDLPRARSTYQQAKSLAEQGMDEPETLRLRIVGARLRRHDGDADGACVEYRSLVAAARNLLADEERLDLLGHFLEALAQRDEIPDVEEIRTRSREALGLFEGQLRRQPGARARRRFRELRQRAFEGVLAGLVGTAQRLSMESDPGQKLLREAWRVVLAIRHPELSRTATEPERETAAHVRDLEDELHGLMRNHLVDGADRDHWTTVMERLVEREITILRTGIEETRASVEPPAEGRALACFQFREMLSTRPVLVLGCRDGRIDAILLPDRLRSGTGSIQDLLPPSLTRLDPPEPWYLFLDGALHHLAIESLPQGPDCLTWFGEDRGIQTCLRSSVHPATRRPIDFSRGWLGIGDVPGRGNLTYLPETRREIEQIQDHLKQRGHPAATLLGEEANSILLREKLAALRPAVLHVATHGCFDKDYPDGCCLFLAETPAVPEREMLPFRRVLELDLEGVDLVVLSACRSSKGHTSRAAGYEGLAWAFLRAGAAQVIASRYSVQDRATADLMSVFYRHLQNHPAAEALGRTRAECLANGMEPSEVSAWSVLS